MRRRLVALSALLLLSSPVMGDWIVTREGETLRTEGPWEERGQRVVFRSGGGALYSLAGAEVDWLATRDLNLHPAVRAVGRFGEANGLEIADIETLRWVVGAMVQTVRAARASRAAPPRTAAPRLVLTDADVAHVVPRAPIAPEQYSIDWRRSYDADPGQVLVAGTFINKTERVLHDVRLEIRLLDAGGELIATLDADLEAPAVEPDEKAAFEILVSEAGFRKLEFGARGRVGKQRSKGTS